MKDVGITGQSLGSVALSRAKNNLKKGKKTIAKWIVGYTTGLSAYAFAAGTSLPWDGPLTTLQNNLTGPVATAISVVAFLSAGAALVFGGDDLGSLVKKLLQIVLAVSLIVLGNKFLAALGILGSGAII